MSHMDYLLNDVITVLFFAIVVVVFFKKIKLNPVIGYIIAGALIGPHGMNLVGYNDATKSLAEFGVVFLLFAIGLELTLERLIQMKHYIFGLGSLQFIITSAVFGYSTYYLLGDPYLSFVIGTAFAISSTAIVLKILSEEKNTDSQVGKISISVLLFQDFAVIPIFILIPLLGTEGINYGTLSIEIIIKSVLALGIIIIAGRFLLRPIMHFIMSSKNHDIFIAATLLVVISAAWITKSLGLSLVLGAFVAGVMIAETEFQHQVESTISQFKALFLGFFFMTEIGMHFDFSVLLQNTLYIILLSVSLILFKVLIFLAIATFARIKRATAWHAALLLSQSGEFAFIIFELAKKHAIINDIWFQVLSVTVGISMALTPLLSSIGKRLEDKFNKIENKKGGSVKEIPEACDHIIVAGYGRVGETVANVLEDVGINYVAIDTDLKRVSKFYKANKPVYYGDITQSNMIDNLNISEARAIVLAISDNKALNRAVKLIVRNYPHTPLIVRAMDIEHYMSLKKLGAKIIIPEIYELGLQMSNEILKLSGASDEERADIISIFRQKFTA